MSKYTFTVRKGGCEICLTTDDKNAIEQQIAIWVYALSRKNYVYDTQTTSPQPFIPEPFETQEQPQELLTEEHAVAGDFAVNEQDTTGEEEQTLREPEHLEENTVQEMQPEFSNDEKTADRVEEFVNSLDTADVLPTDSISLREQENVITINNLFNAESPAKMDFESILEHSVDNISSDTVVKKDEIFCKLVKANNITDRLELLLFTADYFCKYDAKFTFSLKQINGKLMHNLAVIVDHGILKIALDNNYLERAGESEYRLTEYGRSEIYSKAGIWS